MSNMDPVTVEKLIGGSPHYHSNMDSVTVQKLIEGSSCRNKEKSIKYFRTLALNPEQIGLLIATIKEKTDKYGFIRMDGDSRFYSLMQLLDHLREPVMKDIDPFVKIVVDNRFSRFSDEFNGNQIRVFMPEDSKTFVEFIFHTEQNQEIIMNNVEEIGFGDFITSTVEEL